MTAAIALAALLALALDAAIGWPDALYRRVGHPVGLFARLLLAAARRWNHGRHAQRNGALVLLALAGSTAAAMALLQSLLRQTGAWAPLLLALAAWPALAQRSLHCHVAAVRQALARADLPAARRAVGRIVGRDVAVLDAGGVARAAIESLAESFVDGVVAPLVWLLVLGLPGIWVLKAVNTADSLIGHRTPRWRQFGWAAARSDDALNWLPARLGGALICLAGGGWRVMWADARRHASPNAGWPESAMAGALGLQLAGRIRYDGQWQDKPTIGHGRRQASAADIARGLRLYRRSCLLLWVLAGGIWWLH